MWHSLPAAATVGLFAFLVISSDDFNVRIYKTIGVSLGFLSHLILDEIWSIEFKKGSYRFKSSFGTALKLWGKKPWANLVTYAKLGVVCLLVYQDDAMMDRYAIETTEIHQTAQTFIDNVFQRSDWTR